jgi:hypothetical protein
MRYTILFLLSCSFSWTQQLSFKTINLPKALEETSGLETYGDYLITHNDSGHKPVLYFFTPKGKLVKQVRLDQLKNKDWEDIAADSTHYYIADTGNNYGMRENLTIYIIDREFNSHGKIKIKYDAQTTFSRDPKNEFDAEGLTVVGEELMLFSKNRKTLQSQIYVFPKTQGDYSLVPQAVLETESMITAADYSEEEDLLVLTGYNYRGEQFFYTATDFVANGLKKIDLKRFNIRVGRAQIEAVKIINANEFWITSESEKKEPPRLFQLQLKP